MTDTWDAAGFVASSRYRLAVCEYLADRGPGLPSKIAANTDLAQPHVSRALSELRERDVVELLVPESQQKGRLYDLTKTGRVALDRLRRGRNAIEIDVVDADEFAYTELVDYLRDTYEGTARAVARYDGNVADIHFFGSPPSNQRSAPIARLWTTTGPDGEFVSNATGRHEFTVYGLENVTLVELSVSDEYHIGLSLEDEADVPLRGFVEEVERHLAAN